ncbi:MAG: helix-turn-helix domain-containing protein [Clostridiales bacterium]|nr:helix-turn-helix domain-containing protein [Clostridiales bacterium]
MYLEFMQELMESIGVSVHRISPPYIVEEWMDLGLRAEILNISDPNALLSDALSQLPERTIHHFTDEFLCNYTTFLLPDSGECFLAGPMLFEAISESRLDELCEKLSLPPELRGTLQSYFCRIPVLASQPMYESTINVLAKHLFGDNGFGVVYSDPADMEGWYQFSQNYLRIPEKPFLSIQVIEERYAVENGLITAVTNGNHTKAMEMLSKLTKNTLPPRMPNALRDHKDYTITINTLLRKTAEGAGVHPIHIDSFSNQNVKEIEQCISLDQLTSFLRKITIGYCRLIRQYSLRNYSLLVQKVITYIDTDLCADLSLKSLSEQLSVNPNYLSTLFKKEMGTSLTDFVNHRRITHAQRLLLSTDMPIKLVAQNSGIPDIAYFSRLFKRITGMTPKVFRETKTYQEFQECGKAK